MAKVWRTVDEESCDDEGETLLPPGTLFVEKHEHPNSEISQYHFILGRLDDGKWVAICLEDGEAWDTPSLKQEDAINSLVPLEGPITMSNDQD